MSGYYLRDRDDGSVELVEVIPTVIATFTEKHHAARIHKVLVDAAQADAIAAELVKDVTAQVEQKTTGLDQAATRKPATPPKPEVALGKTATALVVKSDEKAAPSARKASDAPTEDDWQYAFERLDAGAELKVVADELRMNPYQLRGKYAASKRRRPAAEPESCSLCGTEFRPSASSPDRCARCSRG